MSASPPKADIGTQPCDVCFVPKADICSAANSSLFDHLVGAGKQRLRHGESERLRGLEIDYKLVLRGRLHREIARLLALENAIDIVGRAPELVGKIRSVGDQAASRDADAVVGDVRQLIAGDEF